MTPSLKVFAALALFGVLGVAAAGLAVRSAMADAPQPVPAAAPAAPRAEPPPLPPAGQPAFKADDDEKKPDPKDKLETVRARITGVEAAKNQFSAKCDEWGDAPKPVDVKDGLKMTFGRQPVKLADLKPGMHVALVYKGNSTELVEVRAAWPRQGAKLTALDGAKGTLTFQIGGDGEGDGFPITLDVAKDARVVVDGLAAGLADVPTGRKVELELGIDKKGVVGIEADGDKGDIPAVVKSYDAAANTLLVEFDASANDRERRVTLCLPVNAGAKVRLSGADAKLTDLKDRTPVRLKMTPDRKGVAAVLAGPPLPPEKDDD